MSRSKKSIKSVIPSKEEKLEEEKSRKILEFQDDWKKYNHVPGLRLTIGDGKKQADSFTLVTWCISPTAAKKMLQVKEEYPEDDFFMLLMAVPEDQNDLNDVVCKLTPFSQTAEYLSFRRPGRHRVFGLVIRDRSSIGCLKKDLFMKDGSLAFPIFNVRLAYSFSLPMWQCFDLKILEGKDYHCVSLARAVTEVPKDFFAKERPEWRKRYVESWYDQPSRDECQFYKRQIVAFTLRPVWAVFIWIVFWFMFWPLVTGSKLVYSFWLILGGVKLEAIDWEEVFCRSDWGSMVDDYMFRNVFNRDIADATDFYRNRGLTGKPIFWLGLSGLILVLGSCFQYRFGSEGWLSLLGWTLGSAAGVFIFWWLAEMVLRFFSQPLDPATYSERAHLQREEGKARLAADMNRMVCSLQPKTGTLADVPEEVRTFHLLANAFKRTHCRPFAK